jgi:hypothetical protein
VGRLSEHILMSFNQPGVKIWWELRRGSFNPHFRNFLNLRRLRKSQRWSKLCPGRLTHAPRFRQRAQSVSTVTLIGALVFTGMQVPLIAPAANKPL